MPTSRFPNSLALMNAEKDKLIILNLEKSPAGTECMRIFRKEGGVTAAKIGRQARGETTIAELSDPFMLKIYQAARIGETLPQPLFEELRHLFTEIPREATPVFNPEKKL